MEGAKRGEQTAAVVIEDREGEVEMVMGLEGDIRPRDGVNAIDARRSEWQNRHRTTHLQLRGIGHQIRRKRRFKYGHHRLEKIPQCAQNPLHLLSDL